MKRNFIITAEMRDLEQRVAKGEISYSRMIENLCKKADEYAEEYHQSELLKLNKSDVSSRSWECNSCGFKDYTDAISEDEIHSGLLACSNCGGDECHLV